MSSDNLEDMVNLIRGETMLEGKRLTLEEFTEKDYTPTHAQVYDTGYNWTELVGAAGIEPYGGIDNIPQELYLRSNFNPVAEPEDRFDLAVGLLNILEESVSQGIYGKSRFELNNSELLQIYREFEEVLINYEELSEDNPDLTPEDLDVSEETIEENIGVEKLELLDELAEEFDYPDDLLPEVVERRRELVDDLKQR